MSTDVVVVGPCKCGGYGIVYDEATEKQIGRCHDSVVPCPNPDCNQLASHEGVTPCGIVDT